MKRHACPAFPHFLHGADYNPEQWLPDKSVWDKDMQLMRLANCNEMSVGIFSWSTLEPREGEFDFSLNFRKKRQKKRKFLIKSQRLQVQEQ